MAEKRVTLAAIAGAHGIGGEVRLKIFAESAESFKAFGTFDAGGQGLTLKSLRETGKQPIARFAEISDRNAAEALRGIELTVARSSLPPLEDGEYYHSDLVGLRCETEAGQACGGVVAVHNFGAGDLLDVSRDDAADFMVPLASARILPDKIVIDEAYLP